MGLPGPPFRHQIRRKAAIRPCSNLPTHVRAPPAICKQPVLATSHRVLTVNPPTQRRMMGMRNGCRVIWMAVISPLASFRSEHRVCHSCGARDPLFGVAVSGPMSTPKALLKAVSVRYEVYGACGSQTPEWTQVSERLVLLPTDPQISPKGYLSNSLSRWDDSADDCSAYRHTGGAPLYHIGRVIRY